MLLGVIFMTFGQGVERSQTRWSVLPSAFYKPETSVGVGAILMMNELVADSSKRATNSQFYLDFTLREQVIFQNDLNAFFNIGKQPFYFTGNSDFTRFPELFFGIGNRTEKQGACLINFNLINFRHFFYMQLKNKVYIGLVGHYQRMSQLSKTVSTSAMSYDEGYTNSGGGVSFLLDERDNILNPKQGHFVQGGLMHYADHQFNSSGFTSSWLDVRYYKKLMDDLVVNTNLSFFNNFGVVPFRMMPALGGAHFLRGHYMGRFRDNNAVIGRAEVRWKMVGRFGLAVFGDCGKVYESLEKVYISKFHYTYGGGIRFRHDLKTDANIRIDYGRGKDSQGLYIVYAEAF